MRFAFLSVIVVAALGACDGDTSPDDGACPGCGGAEASGSGGAPPGTTASSSMTSASASASSSTGAGVDAGFDDAGACCMRDAPYDSVCDEHPATPSAYRCYCPGGGIDPACVVFQGSLIVCCP